MNIGASVQVLRGIDHLRETATTVLNENVRQEQSKRFMTDELTRAPDRVAEAEWRLLTGKADSSRLGQIFRQQRELGLLAALHQG